MFRMRQANVCSFALPTYLQETKTDVNGKVLLVAVDSKMKSFSACLTGSERRNIVHHAYVTSCTVEHGNCQVCVTEDSFHAFLFNGNYHISSNAMKPAIASKSFICV